MVQRGDANFFHVAVYANIGLRGRVSTYQYGPKPGHALFFEFGNSLGEIFSWRPRWRAIRFQRVILRRRPCSVGLARR